MSRVDSIVMLANELAADPGNASIIGRIKSELDAHEKEALMLKELGDISTPQKQGIQTPNRLEWAPNVCDRNSKTDVDSICETVDATLDFLSEFGVVKMDLSGLDFQKVSGQHLATLLRTTGVWKSSVKGWGDALVVAEKALLMDGEDPNDALLGLRDRPSSKHSNY